MKTAKQEAIIFNEFCESKNCPEYIEWFFNDGCGGEWDCRGCKLVGQSHEVMNYPEDCLFKDEISAYEANKILEQSNNKNEENKLPF